MLCRVFLSGSVYKWTCVWACVFRRGGVGVKPAGPVKRNLTTQFRQHIPLLFALQEGGAQRERGGEWPSDSPQRLRDLEGVFRMSLNLKPLCAASSGGGDGGSCRTIEPERAHTLLLSLAPGGGGNLTLRSRPSPSNLGQRKSLHPATPATAAQPPSTLYHAGAGAPQFPLSELLRLQGCQLLLAEERHSGLKSKEGWAAGNMSSTTVWHTLSKHSFLSLPKTRPSYFRHMYVTA